MNDGTNWLALLALAFVMGVKHGLDADHLVAIDGLTRVHTVGRRAGSARWCGLLFSAGHGAVVSLVAGLAGMLSGAFQVPRWFEGLGVSISIVALTTLGFLNLRAVWETPHDEHVPLVGLRAGWFVRVVHSRHPASPALLGALFALSFDTMSLASLFALSAARHGGSARALGLALVFTLGMALVDALNGLWVASLLARADERARMASRWMSGAVGALSLAVAGLGAGRYLLKDAASWIEGRELGLGLSVMTLLAVVFVVSTRVLRPTYCPRVEPPASFCSRAEPSASTAGAARAATETRRA